MQPKLNTRKGNSAYIGVALVDHGKAFAYTNLTSFKIKIAICANELDIFT